MSGLVQQQLNVGSNVKGGGAPHIIAPPPPQASLLYGMDGAPPVIESWGSWTQSSDEVELKFIVPSHVNSKDCKIIFKRNELSVTILQDTALLKGTLFAAIVPDECTYTMENVNSDDKELCVTLTKANEDSTWSFLTE